MSTAGPSSCLDMQTPPWSLPRVERPGRTRQRNDRKVELALDRFPHCWLRRFIGVHGHNKIEGTQIHIVYGDLHAIDVSESPFSDGPLVQQTANPSRQRRVTRIDDRWFRTPARCVVLPVWRLPLPTTPGEPVPRIGRRDDHGLGIQDCLDLVPQIPGHSPRRLKGAPWPAGRIESTFE